VVGCRPEFWARHLRQPVNFPAAVARAAAGGAAIFLEIGSGHALCALARQQLGAESACVESLGNGGLTDRIGLLTGLGRLWSAGARIGWSAFHQDEPLRRVGLVPYPFQRQRYWVQALQPVAALVEEAHHVPQPALVSAAAEAPAAAAASTVEWTELEAEIASVWGEVLGVDVATIGRADTFVSLGGDSLIAARILARLNEEFGLRISVRVLIAPPGTIEALAMEIVAELASAVDAARMDEYLGSAHG
jgi:acyl transferase domain-containing protein